MPVDSAFVTTLDDSGQYQELLSGQPTTCGMRSGRVHLQNGQDCGTHSTKAHEELLVFLSGSGTLELQGGKELQAEAGQVCYIPPHTEHNVKCSSSEPLQYIYCVAPV